MEDEIFKNCSRCNISDVVRRNAREIASSGAFAILGIELEYATRVKNKKRCNPCNHTRNSCSAFIPSKVHRHSSEHTRTVNTHPEQWAAIYAAATGEQLEVRCLAQGHLSRGIEGGESAVHSLPPHAIPAGPRLEPVTVGLQVRLSNL